MIKNIIKYIFIYTICILFVGCSENIFGIQEECDTCVLEMSIPELNIDSNGYYHLDFDDNYIQTFVKLEAYVGESYMHLGWASDAEYCVQMWNYVDCNDVVNPASYSGDDGIANQMMGVHQQHIGDTVNVYCGYYDNYGKQYLNNVKVIINE